MARTPGKTPKPSGTKPGGARRSAADFPADPEAADPSPLAFVNRRMAELDRPGED